MARLVSVWFEEMERSISLVTPTVHSSRTENRFVEQGMPFTANCLENPDHPFPSRSPSPSSVPLHASSAAATNLEIMSLCGNPN